MRRATTIFASLVLLGISGPMPVQAQGKVNADICASTDDTVSPQQRIAACGALIDTLQDQPRRSPWR